MTPIALQKCGGCGHIWRFRRAVCPACAGRDIHDIGASGGGEVWSFTIVHRAPSPELDVPGGYGIALVKLDEGARIMARSPTDLSIGDRVIVAEVDGKALARKP